MPRKAPKVNEIPGLENFEVPTERNGYISQVREYKLITPLFGGGVEPAKADPVTVIRAPEIRGHLRFWWRACRGGQFNTLADMKRAEDDLWGAAATEDGGGPSKVQVVVETDLDNVPQPVQPNPKIAHPYATFPLQPTDEERSKGIKPKTLRPAGIKFKLKVYFPEDLSEEQKTGIEAALWAWETFGGIGARTRRGFGALQLVKVDGKKDIDLPPCSEATAWVESRLSYYVKETNFPDNVPHLSQSTRFKITLSSSRAIDKWRELIKKLKDFRHQRPFLRDEKENSRPGRNRWPEQDEIRRLTGKRAAKHTAVISQVQKFPRAAFGLPIIFEYKKDDQRLGDPQGKNTLQGQSEEGYIQYERLASPLILRPLACTSGFVGIGIILEGINLPEQLILKGETTSYEVQADLEENEARQIMKSDDLTPLLGNQTDVLQAFLDTL
jgi:CRISPR-associated protein Cmr1